MDEYEEYESLDRSERSCEQCKWKYPFHLLATITFGVFHPLVCGICALEISNKTHSMKRDKFDGTRAEKKRQAAITWRKANPQLAPPASTERKQ